MARSRTIVLSLASFALALTCAINVGWAATAPEISVSTDVGHDVSPPLRDLVAAAAKNSRSAPGIVASPLHILPLAIARPVRDPVEQTRADIAFGATIGLNFAGLGVGFPGFTPQYLPPDTSGAAGATQYAQWVNTSFAVFDKATGNIILGPMDGNALWLGFGGGCEYRNDGDPVVEYDKQAGRWVMSQFTSTAPYLECVAVSQTSDATGKYNRYAFLMGEYFADYPRVGVWPDAYYFSFNLFNSARQLVGGQAAAFDRAAMLAGETATQVYFASPNTYNMVPSDWDGATPPPAGSPDYFVQLGANSLNIYTFHVDFVNTANSTFNGPINVPVAPFTPSCADNQPVDRYLAAGPIKFNPACVPQKGTDLKLELIADRPMYRAAYRNFGDHESLVVLHDVARRLVRGKPAGAALRWYELRSLAGGAPSVFQQGSYAPNQQWRWMGSAGMDAAGDIAIGYSASGPGIFPAIRITGRTPADPAGTLEAEKAVINGTAPQIGQVREGDWRWGDYSAMSIDPGDDCTFWYTTEYITKRHESPYWSTRIASFKFPGCSAP